MDTEDSKETTDPLRPHIPSYTYSGAGGETPNSSSESDSSASEGEGVVALFEPPPERRKASGSDYSPTSSKSPSSESASEGHSSDSDCSEAARPRQNVTKHVQFMEDSDSSSSNSTAASRSQHPSYPPHNSDFEYDSFYPRRRKATRNVTYTEYLESEDSNSDTWPAKRHRHHREESDSEFEMKSVSPSEESFMDESSEEEYLPEGRKAQRRRAQRKVWDEEEDSDSDYMPGGRRRKRTARRTARRRVGEPGYSSGQSSSGSEFDPGGAKRKKKPSDFVRMTGRRTGVVSYKESSGTDSDEVVERREQQLEVEEDNREAIERVLKKRIGKVGETGNKTTCYGGGSASPAGREGATEVQYLVKWLNWSHLHNTWETEQGLLEMNVKGMKRFYNFLKREEERETWEREANPEDIEYVKCQEELQDQLLEHVTQVERVIAARHGEDGSQEYLCKWRGLPYSECTWEDGGLIADRFQEQIDAFLERNTSDCIPGRSAKVLRHRPRFSIMKAQLRSFGGPSHLVLRDYQLDGVNWLCHSWCKNNSVILADEMGLGKTIQTIAFLHCLYHEHALYGPFLLVVPLSTMPAWQREFEQWAPEINTVVYLGDISSRNMIQEHEWMHPNQRLKFNALLTTYEILLKDQAFLGSVAWAVLVVDEAHRLKNDDSLLYRTLMQFRTNHRLLVTGTPLQNSLKELWSLLHFIMEKKFPDWEQFEAEHRVYGEGDASNLTSLHQQLQPFLLRRVKKDVEKSLPAKMEQILRVEMSSVQKQYYRWILSKNYKALSKGVKGSITGFINLVMELKKCCNHIWIVRAPDEPETRSTDKLQTLIRGSGKLFLLDKLLVRLRQTGHRVLIFSQMVRMLDILAEYMQLRHFPFQRLDGSIRGELRRDAIDHFNAEGSQDFCFLLSTRAGGLGVNLATADTVIIVDSDWNPQNDLQAQARAHRIGQTKQVNIYRLVTRSSVEEDIVERAKRKMVLDHLVIQRMDTTGRTVLSQSGEHSRSIPFSKEELTTVLKFGAVELFKVGEGEGDHDLQELDIDEILRRAETQATTEESSAANDLLSQFKVASFTLDEEELGGGDPVPTPTEGKTLLLSPTNQVATPWVEEKSWEEIIPQSYLAKMEEEEKAREQLKLYLPPRRRHVQNYCEDSPVKKRRPPAAAGGGGGGGGGRRGRREVAPAGATVVSKNIRGFSNNEIRRFVRSYRKFGNPKSRLEAIAADAELQEKSLSELEHLADTLHQGCLQASTEHAARVSADPDYNPKTDKGPSLQLSGVTISTASILRREEELQALATCIPANPTTRMRYRLLTHPKPVGWGGVRWSAVDDAKLLIGVYEHGLGNWENIRDDPALGFSKKILPVEKSRKPQASHLQTRVEYLLKLVQSVAREHARKKNTKGRSTARKKPSVNSGKISKYFAREQPCSGGSLTVNIPRELVEIEGLPRGRKRPAAPQHQASLATKKMRTGKSGSSASGKRSGRGERGERGEGSNATTVEGDIGDIELDKKVFEKCKSLLRPVKKALASLSPSDKLSEQKTLDHYKKALVEIGDHITTCLLNYRSEEVAEWRTNLWVFVSKFTASSPQKLHKMYKKAKREPGKNQASHALSQSSITALTARITVVEDLVAMMPVKKRYLDMAAHASQHSHHNDGQSHREHYDPGYRPSPSHDAVHPSHPSDHRP